MTTQAEERERFVQKEAERGTDPKEAADKADALSRAGHFEERATTKRDLEFDVEVPDPFKNLQIDSYLTNLSASRGRILRVDAGDMGSMEQLRQDHALGEVGIEPEEFEQRARDAGIDLDWFEEQVGRKNRLPSEVIKEAKERGDYAFQDAETRSVMNRRRDIEHLATQKKVILQTPENIVTDMQFVQSGQKSAFGGTMADDLREDPDAAQLGEAGIVLANNLMADIISKSGDEGVDLTQKLQVYGKQMNGYKPYIIDRQHSLVNTWKRQQVDAPETDRLTHEELEDKAQKQAVKEIAMAKMVGLWTGTAFVPPDYLVGETGVDLKEKGFFGSLKGAMAPPLEIVGLNNAGNVVVRQPGLVQEIFDIVDAPQSFATGVLMTPDSLTDWDEFRTAGLEGIAERRNFMEASLEVMDPQTTAGYVATMMGGLLPAIFFPDLFWAGAKAYKLTNAVHRGLGSHMRARSAVRTLDTFAEAVAAGRLDDANVAYKQLHEEFPSVSKEVEKVLQDVAEPMSSEAPEILRETGGAALSKRLPDPLDIEEVHISPPHRRPEYRPELPREGEEMAPLISRPAAYDYTLHLEKIEAVKQRVLAKDDDILKLLTNKPMRTKTVSQMGLLTKAMGRLGVAEADINKFAKELGDNLHLAVKDPDTWLQTVESNLRAVKGLAPDADLGPMLTQIRAIAKVARKVAKDEGAGEDILDALVKAERAVRVNAEVHAISAVLIRTKIAHEYAIKTKPIIPRLMEKAFDTVELTHEGRELARKFETLFKVTRQQAAVVARIADARAKTWAREVGGDPADWYATRIAGVKDKDAFMRRFFMDPDDPRSLIKHVLPDGYNLQQVEGGKWAVVDVSDTVIGKAHRDPMDAAESAINKLLDDGVIERHVLDESPVRVGPLLLGMERDVAELAAHRQAFEYAACYVEDGNIMRVTSNSPTYVGFTPVQMAKMARAEQVVFTHNHPGGVVSGMTAMLSDADVILAAKIGAREMRATGPGGTWVLEVEDWGELSRGWQWQHGADSRAWTTRGVVTAIDDFEDDVRSSLSRILDEVSLEAHSAERWTQKQTLEAFNRRWSEELGRVLERHGIRVRPRLEPRDAGVGTGQELVGEALEAARGTARERGVDLRFQPQGPWEPPYAEVAQLEDIAGGITETVRGELGMDKARIVQLLGAKMYKGGLQDTTVKELVQNSWDGVKGALNKGLLSEGEGWIEITLDNTTRTIIVKDNGIGMTPETVKKAFFKIAGTHKEDVPIAQRSGGLGLAKMLFLISSESVEVTTIRNGVRTTAKSTPTQLVGGDFPIEITRGLDPKLHGTEVRVKVPESYINESGATKTIWWSRNPSKLDSLQKPLLGDVEIRTIRSYGDGFDKPVVSPLGRNFDHEATPFFTRVSFSWGSADIYLNPVRDSNARTTVLSAGVYQFDDWEISSADVPYNVIIDVHPNVKAEATAYPFTNTREGWQATIEDDIKALRGYLKKYSSGKSAEQTASVFDAAVAMDRVELGELAEGGRAPRAWRKKHEEPPRAATPEEIEEMRRAWRELRDLRIEAGDVKTREGKVVHSEKKVAATFEAEKKVTGPGTFFDIKTLDPKKPLFHNNTSVDYIAEAEKIGTETDPRLFFAELGSLIVEYKEKLAKADRGYKHLDDPDLIYAAGVSIDKGYKGVHVGVPFRAFFLNPLAYSRIRTADGMADALYFTLAHEAAHSIVGKHNEDMILAMHKAVDAMGEAGEAQVFRDAIFAIFDRHWDAFDKMRTIYGRFDTKNVAVSLDDAGKSLSIQAATRAAARDAPHRVGPPGRGEGAPGIPGTVAERAETGRGVEARPDQESILDVVESKLIELGVTQPRARRRKPDVLFQRADETDPSGTITGKNPIYYSKLAQVVEGMPRKLPIDGIMKFLGRQVHPQAGQPQIYPRDVIDKSTGEVRFKKGTPIVDKAGKQLVHSDYLLTKGVKQDEIQWTNIAEFITDARAAGKKSVTRDELLTHLRDNRVEIDTTLMGVMPPEVATAVEATNEAHRALVPAIKKWSEELQKLGIPMDSTEIHRIRSDPGYIRGGEFQPFVHLNSVLEPGLFDKLPYDIYQILWRSDLRELAYAVSGDRVTQELLDEIPRVLREVREKAAGQAHHGSVPVMNETGRLIDRLEAMSVVAERFRLTNQLENSPEFQAFRRAKNRSDYLERTRVRAPTHENYTLPGGENYRETLITLPRKPHWWKDLDDAAFIEELYRRDGAQFATPEQMQALRGSNPDTMRAAANMHKRDLETRFLDETPALFDEGNGSHWSTPNVLVHYRAKDRVDETGRKILFIEEIQSDWHQKGREAGYALGPAETRGIKDAAKEMNARADLGLKELRAYGPRGVSLKPPRPDLERGLWFDLDDMPTHGRLGTDKVRKALQAVLDGPYGWGLHLKDLGPTYVHQLIAVFKGDPSQFASAYLRAGGGRQGLNQVIEMLNQHPVAKAYDAVAKAAADASELLPGLKIKFDGIDAINGSAIYRVDGHVFVWNSMEGANTAIPVKHATTSLSEAVSAGLRSAAIGTVPSAPFKDTKAWTSLAVKHIMRTAADEGYDGVAFTSGTAVRTIDGIGLKEKAAKDFYDVIVPSVVRQAIGKKNARWFGKTRIDLGKAPVKTLDRYGLPLIQRAELREFNLVELSREVTQEVGVSRPLFQTRKVDDDALMAKAATEFINDGRAWIYALENGDVSSIIHELGHIFRRDLTPADMDVVTTWLKTEHTLDVTHEAGRFRGSDDAIEKAEELFARGFESYIASGKAPTSSLTSVFEKLKNAMVRIYRAIRGSDIDVKMNDDMRILFDKMLMDSPPDGPPLPHALDMVGKSLMGDLTPAASVFDHIAMEAQRLGIKGTTAARLQDIYESQPEGQRVIQLPQKMLHDWRKGGVDELTEGDLVALQWKLDNDRMQSMAAAAPSVPLKREAQAVSLQETLPSERIMNWASEGGGLKSVFAGATKLVLGGDAMDTLRLMPPLIRQSIMAGVRPVKQAYAEAIAIVADRDWDRIYRYLGGEVIDFAGGGGREVTTSGWNAMSKLMSGIYDDLATATDPMKGPLIAEHMDDLRYVGKHFGPGQNAAMNLSTMKKIKGPTGALRRDTTAPAVMATLYDPPGDFYKNLIKAVGAPSKQAGDPPNLRYFEYQLAESLLFHTGILERGGKLFEGTGTQMAKSFLDDIETIYGKDQAARVAVLVAGHGHALRGRQVWSSLGVSVEESTVRAFERWLNGEALEPKQLREVKAMARTHGLNAGKFDIAPVLGTRYYVPKAARERMSEALAMGIMREPKSIFLKSEQTTTGRASMLMRYMKLRMTRGFFVVRQRYFMMNTFDHFTQMGMTAGFGPATVSTARMVNQNLMAFPGFLHVQKAFQKAGVLSPKAQENVRRWLQSGGDSLAGQLGRFMSDAKYNINVNKVLEGHSGTVSLKGRIYTYKDIRNIAIEEGVFASFDTAALGKVIKKVRKSVEKSGKKVKPGKFVPEGGWGEKFNDVLADWTDDLIGEMSEAWAERERLGAMITLIESGMDPRSAARMTIGALYDYAGSMSKVDRAWWVSILMPFWAYQKNANRQVLDTMFSPAGAWRMGILRRAQEHGTEAISEILYQSMVDPYGVDPTEMPKTTADNYWALRTALESGHGPIARIDKNVRRHLEAQLEKKLEDLDDEARNFIENGYGGVGNVPPNVRQAMHIIFAEKNVSLIEGRLVQLDYVLNEARGKAKAMKTGGFIIPRPDKSGLPEYYRDRPALSIPHPLKEATRLYYGLLQEKYPEHPYTELFLPDSTIHAGMRYIANATATYIMLGGFLGSVGVNAAEYMTGAKDEKGEPEDIGFEYAWGPSIINTMRKVVDVQRAPLVAPGLAGYGIGSQWPRRIHPALVSIVEHTFLSNLVTVPAIEDPFARDELLKEDKALRAAGKLTGDRFYMEAGPRLLFFDNAGLGELNRMLISWEKTPLEESGKRGELLRWARVILGAETYEVWRHRQARREEPKWPMMSTTPPK